MKAYFEAWRRWRDYSGVTSRRDFCAVYFCQIGVLSLFSLFAVLVIILLGICGVKPVEWLEWFPYAVTNIMTIFNCAFLVPTLSMMVRRLRDAGYSPKSFLWLLLPGIGTIAFFARLFGKTKSEFCELNT